jgi:hypothetical protein
MYPLQIKINKPFSEQYTLDIYSDLMAVDAKMNSQTQIRWDLNVIKVEESFIEMRLVLLDHVLLKANNPLIKEISKLTSTFSRMYNELHLVIDHKGNILEVLNLSSILAKWGQTKFELSEIANGAPEIKDIIILNDSIFLNKNNLITNLQKSEFFMLYFNSIFGNKLPYHNVNFIMPNFLNTANLNWEKKITCKETKSNMADLEIITTPLFVQKDYNERAYSQFKNKMDIKKIIPSLLETGSYAIDIDSGKVFEATLKREEVADEQNLYSKLEYKFMSDSRLKDPNKLVKANASGMVIA